MGGWLGGSINLLLEHQTWPPREVSGSGCIWRETRQTRESETSRQTKKIDCAARKRVLHDVMMTAKKTVNVALGGAGAASQKREEKEGWISQVIGDFKTTCTHV